MTASELIAELQKCDDLSMQVVMVESGRILRQQRLRVIDQSGAANRETIIGDCRMIAIEVVEL